MSIRDKDGRLEITPGEWKYATTDKGRPKTVDKNKFAICTANAQPYNHSDFELCAEAGTIANRYDATPFEMVETILELRTAFFFIDDPNRHEWIAKVLAKTAKYEEK